MRDRQPRSTVATAVAALVVVVGLLAATGILLSAKHSAALRADIRAREVAANAVPTLGGALRTELTAA